MRILTELSIALRAVAMCLSAARRRRTGLMLACRAWIGPDFSANSGTCVSIGAYLPNANAPASAHDRRSGRKCIQNAREAAVGEVPWCERDVAVVDQHGRVRRARFPTPRTTKRAADPVHHTTGSTATRRCRAIEQSAHIHAARYPTRHGIHAARHPMRHGIPVSRYPMCHGIPRATVRDRSSLSSAAYRRCQCRRARCRACVERKHEHDAA